MCQTGDMNKVTNQHTAKQTLADSDLMVNGMPVVKSEVIFRSQQQCVIEHAGEQYTLRITKHGKLILTK